MDNDCEQHRQPSAQKLNNQSNFAMDGLLSKKFNNFVDSKNYDAAHKIIKEAITLDYPSELINTWKRRLDQLENNRRHPLDYALESNGADLSLSYPPGLDLRKCFRAKVEGYFVENKIEINLSD